MMTIDRINRLRQAFGLSAMIWTTYPAHATIGGETSSVRLNLGVSFVINELDVLADLNTRGKQVGARLALLERHVFGRKDYTFWLGADGENPDKGLPDSYLRCDCDWSFCRAGPGSTHPGCRYTIRGSVSRS